MSGGRAAVLGAALTALLGCGPGEPAPGEDSPSVPGAATALPDLVTPAVGGVLFESPEAAAREALALIGAGDAGRLSGLAVSQAEFRAVVYPRLPASRPERNTSAEFVWGRLHQRSRSALAYTLERYRGRRFEVVAVDFVGETTDYGPFQVHRETVLTVETPDGERGTLRIFGSMLEQEGRYKIFSFVTD